LWFDLNDRSPHIPISTVSTKILLSLALKEDIIINADTTYKLIWQGFPVLLLGTTDHNRKFHLRGIAAFIMQ